MRFQVPKSVTLMGAMHTGISTAFPRGQLKKAKGQGSVTSDRYPGHHPPPSTREMNAFLESYQECSESWGLREIPSPVGDPDKRICAAFGGLQGVRGAFLALAFQLSLRCHHQLCSYPAWHPCVLSQTAGQGRREEHADLVLVSSLPLMCHLESKLVGLKL